MPMVPFGAMAVAPFERDRSQAVLVIPGVLQRAVVLAHEWVEHLERLGRAVPHAA
jgi:hypothetical protein